MLQLMIESNQDYSFSEMTQMAVEAGISWVVLRLPECIDGLRDEINTSVEICRDAGIILTVTDRPDLAREYGMHGVFITDKSVNPMSVRENLGAEAIIGVCASTPDAMLSLENADIDYVAASVNDSNAIAAISEIRAAGSKLPVVALINDKDFGLNSLEKAMTSGFTGICGGSGLFSLKNPVDAMTDLLAALGKLG